MNTLRFAPPGFDIAGLLNSIEILAACSFPIYLLDSIVVKYIFLVLYKVLHPADPLLMLAFLVTVNLLVCLGIIYLLQKLLPKNYSQYVQGI